jgi:solute carrier family 25 phosphate transporter 23/24/25/41
MLARSIVYPIDVIKLLTQVGTDNLDFVDSCRRLFRERGLFAFWRGNMISIVNQGFYTGIKFFVIKELHTMFGNRQLSIAESAFIGAAAGIASQAALYPLDFLRTRMVLYPTAYTSFWQATTKIASEEGFFALWTGLLPTLAGSIPYEGSQYVVYDKLRQKRGRVTPLTNAINGTIAGIVSQSIAYPFETVRKLMMITNADGTKMYQSMTECFAKVYENEGIGGFFRGLGINTFKVIPFSALQYTLYDEMCNLFLRFRRFQAGEL